MEFRIVVNWIKVNFISNQTCVSTVTVIQSGANYKVNSFNRVGKMHPNFFFKKLEVVYKAETVQFRLISYYLYSDLIYSYIIQQWLNWKQKRFSK